MGFNWTCRYCYLTVVLILDRQRTQTTSFALLSVRHEGCLIGCRLFYLQTRANAGTGGTDSQGAGQRHDRLFWCRSQCLQQKIIMVQVKQYYIVCLGEGVNKEKEEGKEREKEGRTHPRRGPKQKQTGAAW